MSNLLDKIKSEPAAVIGVVTSIVELFAKGWTPEVAIPAAVGILIRFFVSPAVKTPVS